MRLGRYLAQPSKIIIRNIERRPVRSLISAAGIAVACATMLTGGFLKDSVYYTARVQFEHSQKQDLTVAFTETTSSRAAHDLRSMRGVGYVETFRMVPVRFRNGNLTYRTVINGIPGDSRLSLILDRDLRRITLPEHGIVLTDYFRRVLDVREGDMLTLEVLEGGKPVRRVRVAGFVSQYIGLMGFMEISELNRLIAGGSVGFRSLPDDDPAFRESNYRELVGMPGWRGPLVRRGRGGQLFQHPGQAMLFFTLASMLTACCIAVGVVYNSMRIALAERSRELSASGSSATPGARYPTYCSASWGS
jgi:putative ABC transport system permease protein